DGDADGSRELGKAVSDAFVANGEQFVDAFVPMVENIVGRSMTLNRNSFVDALFPLMGPLIRKSIAENFGSMINSFSKSLENALSWRGIKWRFEAIKSGKSFGDVVLLHTINYRVEHVFFIHSETGLVLAHIQNEGVETRDADMVSAMLTAIGDFAKDCFASNQQEGLDTLRLGEHTIMIEAHAESYLACVVRGTLPTDLRHKVRDTLDLLTVEFSVSLHTFNGDVSPFVRSTVYLQQLLETQYAKEYKPFPTWGKRLAAVLAALTISVCGYLYYNNLKTNWQVQKALSLLREEPGILVLGVLETQDNKQLLSILRDDLAKDPREVIQSVIDPKSIDVSITPYVSLDTPIVERRVRQLVALPKTVEMSFDNGIVTLSGTASFEWINNTRRIMLSAPGIKWVDTTELDDPALEHIAELVTAIEEITIEFPINKSVPINGEQIKLEKAVQMLVELEYAAGRIGLIPNLIIYGHADSSGNAIDNYRLSNERAQTLAAMLYSKGSSIPISLYGMGDNFAKDINKSYDRRIEMRVRLVQSTQPSWIKRANEPDI
ncbi:MAG: hypothetical protein LBN32_04755, partial [Helicobacteraceae bacterium]|nr:hypothetical protein [Helicobacteraceae bacterium]